MKHKSIFEPIEENEEVIKENFLSGHDPNDEQPETHNDDAIVVSEGFE